MFQYGTMEEEIQLIEYKEVDLSNSILIEAFPTVGLVSSIAGHFIVEQLKLEEIGTISSRYFMPAADAKALPGKARRQHFLPSPARSEDRLAPHWLPGLYPCYPSQD